MNWVDEIRKQIPAANKSCFLDVAYDCGGAEWSVESTKRFFEDWGSGAARNERGGPGRQTLFETMDETRKLVNDLIGGEGWEQVAFTKNTNEGTNAILNSFDFSKGDNIVTDGLEHQSVIMPCLNIRDRKGIEVRIAKDVADGRVRAEELKSLCDENTKMMLVSYVQSASGYLLDLSELGPWCRERGIFLIVDAIQSVGVIPFRACEWCVDAVVAAAYKALLGVNCISFAYMTKDLLKHMWPSYIAAGPVMGIDRTTYILTCKDDTKARKMENSTVDALGVYILHDSLEKLMNIGIDNICEHVFSLYDAAYSGIKKLGFEIVQKENEKHAGIISIISDNSKEIFEFLRSRNICLSHNEGKFVRVSFCAFSTMEDVNYFLDALSEIKVR